MKKVKIREKIEYGKNIENILESQFFEDKNKIGKILAALPMEKKE